MGLRRRWHHIDRNDVPSKPFHLHSIYQAASHVVDEIIGTGSARRATPAQPKFFWNVGRKPYAHQVCAACHSRNEKSYILKQTLLSGMPHE